VVVVPDPFLGMGAWRNSTETQQSGHAHGLDQRSKMEEAVLRMERLRASDVGQTRLRLDPAEGARRRCKNSSVLSCIDKRRL